MKEIKWFKSNRSLHPSEAYNEDSKAVEIAKKEDCIVRIIWEDTEHLCSSVDDSYYISKTITKYKEIEYIDGNIEYRVGKL